MRIGAHESTAGGLHLAFGRAEADGCEALQIFTGYNTRWAPRPLPHEQASLFRSEAARLELPVLSHAIYLINLASPHGELWQRSVDALTEELERCETLGVELAVLHPGSHMGAGEASGLRRVSAALGELHRRTAGFRARIALENTAGQGNTLGHAVEHLEQIIDRAPGGDRLAVCIDTCHAHAAGHDLRSARGYATFVDALERRIGLDRVRAFHLNDSLRELGSRRDRHQHVGEGALGRAAFARLVNDPRFAGRPAVVETPAEPDGRPSFARNVGALKSLRGDRVVPGRGRAEEL
mgnify:CR=1 FL=1